MLGHPFGGETDGRDNREFEFELFIPLYLCPNLTLATHSVTVSSTIRPSSKRDSE